MLWLAVHMWVLLFTAFAIGLGAGWWIWGRHASPPAPAPLREAALGSLELEDDAPTGDLASEPQRSL
jgi:hypothetical protein